MLDAIVIDPSTKEPAYHHSRNAFELQAFSCTHLWQVLGTSNSSTLGNLTVMALKYKILPFIAEKKLWFL